MTEVSDRDQLLDVLLPIAIQLSCMRAQLDSFDLTQCGECLICKVREIALPIVKWTNKGYRSPEQRTVKPQEDRRNIIDEFKGKPSEEIKAILKQRALPFAVLMEHWQGDFNLSTLLRNANAFGANETFYLGGSKHWDRRGALGVHNYSDFNFLRTYEELNLLQEKYVFVGLENISGAINIKNFTWPKNSLMVFGEESCGLTDELLKRCSYVVSIPQTGSVRSLNAGCASAIAMYDYVTKYK